MPNISKLAVIIATLIFFPTITLGSDLELKTFVENAQEHIEKVGFQTACKEFEKKNTKFNKGELYIFAYDFKGYCLCHGAKPFLIGKELINIRDKKGKYLIQEMIKKAQIDEQGYIDYYWPNPLTNKVSKKRGYILKINSRIWIGSGYYPKE